MICSIRIYQSLQLLHIVHAPLVIFLPLISKIIARKSSCLQFQITTSESITTNYEKQTNKKQNLVIVNLIKTKIYICIVINYNYIPAHIQRDRLNFDSVHFCPKQADQ